MGHSPVLVHGLAHMLHVYRICVSVNLAVKIEDLKAAGDIATDVTSASEHKKTLVSTHEKSGVGGA